MSGAARFDRRVYLGSHPVLFAVLAATRRWPVLRLGSMVLAHSTEAYVAALTRVPLDRTAEGTTGGAARAVSAGEVLFDQTGVEHRAARRALAARLGTAGVEALRPVWRSVLERRLRGSVPAPVEVVGLAAELAGATAAALLDVAADPLELAGAARAAAAATARAHLPGVRRPGTAGRARRAAAALTAVLARGRPVDNRSGPSSRDENGLAAMVAVAAVNTTVAALPRAAAWCAKEGWWDRALDPDPEVRLALAAELLRLTAPTPVLPRVAAGPGDVGGCPVRAGDRLLLVARHAAGAHRRGAVSPQVASLVFGAGPHACPGAALARAQLADALAALGACRPVVGRARVDRRSALPGWRELWLHPTTTTPAALDAATSRTAGRTAAPLPAAGGTPRRDTQPGGTPRRDTQPGGAA